MPAQAIIDIGSHYEGSGVQQATQGVDKLDNSLNKVEGSSDRLITKLERPIGRIAYGGLAESALSAASANAKLDGVTGTLHQTFHVLGSALLFVNPELGFLALGAAAIITIFAKLSNSVIDSAENIQKNVELQRKLKEEYKESSEVLLKHGVINKQQAAILRESSAEAQKEIEKVKEQTKVRAEYLSVQIEILKKAKESSRDDVERSTIQVSLNERQQEFNAIAKATSGLLQDVKKDDQDRAKSIEHHYKALGELAQVQAKVINQEKERRDFAGIDKKTLDDMVSAESEITLLTEKLNNTKSESDRIELQAHIDYLNRRVSADRSILSSEKSVLDERAKIFSKYDQLIADEWLKSNHNMQKVAEAIGASIIKDAANVFATKLEIAAAADIFLNPGLAIAELAGAAAIRTIGGGISSDLTGALTDTGSPSTVSSGLSQGGNLASGTVPNQMNLNVTISGGIPDPHSIQYIMRAINEQVQQFNGVVVASVVKPAVGQLPGS